MKIFVQVLILMIVLVLLFDLKLFFDNCQKNSISQALLKNQSAFNLILQENGTTNSFNMDKKRVKLNSLDVKNYKSKHIPINKIINNVNYTKDFNNTQYQTEQILSLQSLLFQKSKRSKRNIEYFQNNFLHMNYTFSLYKYTRHEFKFFLDKLKPCINKELKLSDFQLVNLGSFSNPIIYFVYFDDYQYIESNITKIRSRAEYINIYLSLIIFDFKKYQLVLKILKFIDEMKVFDIRFICNIQQIYIYDNKILIVFKDGESFYFGNYDLTKFEDTIQYKFIDEYNTLRRFCERKHIKSVFNHQCCKDFALATFLNQNFKSVFLEKRIDSILYLCLRFDLFETLSKSLYFDFEPKKIFSWEDEN